MLQYIYAFFDGKPSSLLDATSIHPELVALYTAATHGADIFS